MFTQSAFITDIHVCLQRVLSMFARLVDTAAPSLTSLLYNCNDEIYEHCSGEISIPTWGTGQWALT